MATTTQIFAPNIPLTGPSGPPASAAFGSTPQLPNLQTTQNQAITGNLTNLGNLYGLAGNVNQFQNTQAPLGLQQNLPGYQNLLNQASTNAQSLLQGQIPQDVINQLTQSAAERGISTGSPGSPNANTALLSALGQTSLGLEQQGLSNFQTLAGMTPQAAPMDLSPYMVTPQQQQELGTAQALYNAAPDPAAAAAAGLGAAQAGVGTGRAIGPTAPTAPTVPNLSPGAIGSTVPTYGNPQGGITYGGEVYPSGTGPTSQGGYGGNQGQTGDTGQYQTGSYEGDVAAGYLTGDPLTDWMMGLSDFGPDSGTSYFGSGAGGPADTGTGGYTYMGPQGGQGSPWDDLSSQLYGTDPSMMGYDPTSGLYSDTGAAAPAQPGYDPYMDIYGDQGGG